MKTLMRAASAAIVALLLIPIGSANAHAAEDAPSRYLLTIDGVEVAAFTRLTVIDGPKPSIFLEHRHASSKELWIWHEAARFGQAAAVRSAVVRAVTAISGISTSSYDLDGFISTIVIGRADSTSDRVPLESLTLVVVDRVQHTVS